ncbi:DUF885 domain-containing protein [Aliiglaciecola sp. 3_MG-2023]|uniref:DUF885 domain-containing protein n=1 Tax=Aliiglaciecola sp. 3_MG-2023 TaxID=3062644 RepID=UPI0026E374E7|nr:DUF885 domain-containing protein [Aliiglaciecola sp. 3_MG-2023]MDO6695167.1 DUF885 domain-containing protein [Aliiglaciecola sp. 3_MG-2023]
MKKFFKWTGLLLLTLILFGGALGAHEWYAKKPLFFRAFLDRTLIKIALDDPELLTSIGVLDGMGFKGHNAKLNDDSLEKNDEMYVLMKEVRATLLDYSDSSLDESQLLSKEIALYLLDAGVASEPYRFHNYPVNQLFGLQSDFPSFMDAQHQVNTVEDAENYNARLNKLGVKFAQNMEGLLKREEKDIIPPLFVIERVLDEMQAFVDLQPEENILYTSLEKKIDDAEQFDTSEKSRVLAGTSKAIASQVYPAYQSYINYFEKLKSKAGTDDGLWRLEGGDIAYQQALAFFTTTDYSADYIHQTGLSEVDRIQKQILTILEAEDFDVSDGFTTAIEALKNDERFYYPDTDEGRAQILADYQTILDEINAAMGEVFNVLPKASMEVKRIPEFKEKTAPGAYYQQPSMDGSRPGVFYANLYDIKATPKYGMRTLAYHEAIPGHHFQVSISMELEGLPIFRTLSPFTAYTEGWALYAERLAWELGFEEDPYDNIGRLQAELFRAVRLVVDTGIHAKKWTREEAIEYMLNNTGIAESDVVSEIERYIVMPGQATSYKVGMMKILELREKAKVALGDKFNLADYHDVVLKNGAVPLEILERLVDQYIENTSI